MTYVVHKCTRTKMMNGFDNIPQGTCYIMAHAERKKHATEKMANADSPAASYGTKQHEEAVPMYTKSYDRYDHAKHTAPRGASELCGGNSVTQK